MSRRVHRLKDWPAELQEAARTAAAEGRTVSSLQCPACAGGRSREDSLSVWTRDGYAKAHCWRNGCNYTADAPLGEDVIVGPATFKPRIFDGALQSPGENCGMYILDRYRVTPLTLYDLGVQEVVGKAAIYMPVWGPFEHTPRGGMVRYFDGTQPKAVSYKATDMPWQAWYLTPSFEDQPLAPVVVVEDQLSAMRCWQLHLPAVALLGTNLNEEKAEEIQQVAGTRRVLLALDADAFGKACAYAHKYPWLQVRRLEHDLKDGTDDYIKERLLG